MAIGPIQLLAIGFQSPDFKGEILDEIERLKQNDTVRLVDSLTVYKDAEGEVTALEMSNLTDEEDIEFGAMVGALIGLGMGGEEGAEAGAEIGAEAAAAGAHVFNEGDAWDVMAAIPNDSAAAILLLEHHWAIPLRDAIARAGGFRLTEGFIDPLDLVAIGFLTAQEAEALGALEPGEA